MINKNLINLLLLVSSTAIFFVIVLPAYNGSGYNQLKLTGFIEEYYKNKSINDYLTTANDLNSSVDIEVNAFNTIPQDATDKIARAVPAKKDILRNINDVYNLAIKNKLSPSDFKFTKPTASNNLDAKQIKKTHEIVFNMKGEYYNFLKFLKEFENSLEFYNIKSLTVTSSESETISNDLKYVVIAETYEINR